MVQNLKEYAVKSPTQATHLPFPEADLIISFLCVFCSFPYSILKSSLAIERGPLFLVRVA